MTVLPQTTLRAHSMLGMHDIRSNHDRGTSFYLMPENERGLERIFKYHLLQMSKFKHIQLVILTLN